MCITQIWTYRECGCHYNRVIPCDPSFDPISSPPYYSQRIPPDSTYATDSNRSLSSTIVHRRLSHSSFEDRPHFPRLKRECSLVHTVHKSFLEPICDDCLLEELGLQPELGPILGGRDQQEGLHGEEWLLESKVEIDVEGMSEGPEEENNSQVRDENGSDADDEGEFRGRRIRRRGIDLSRDELRISSGLPEEQKRSLEQFRDLIRATGAEGSMAKAYVKMQREKNEDTSWARHLRLSLRKRTLGDAEAQGKQDETRDPSLPELQDPGEESYKAEDFEHAAMANELSPKLHASPIDNEPKEENHPTWPQHLHSDLQRHHRRHSSAPSNPQTASTFSSSAWRIGSTEVGLSISSSEFERDLDSVVGPSVPIAPSPKTHNRHHTPHQSLDSIASFTTAFSSPSSPRGQPRSIDTVLHDPDSLIASSSPTFSPRLPNLNALSLHPLHTPLRISTPTRPHLPTRTSSLFSPPPSSPLLHSSPPLRQLPTSAFVCVHEVTKCLYCTAAAGSPTKGEQGQNVKVLSCVCAEGASETKQQQMQQHQRQQCAAQHPLVRSRWVERIECPCCGGEDCFSDDVQIPPALV